MTHCLCILHILEKLLCHSFLLKVIKPFVKYSLVDYVECYLLF